MIHPLRIPFFAVSVLLSAALTYPAAGQSATRATPAPNATESALIREMVGTWGVQQRMWPGAKTSPVELPPAIARRRLLQGGFLEEVMELPPGATAEPFTRVAYFLFNLVTRRFEYASLDSRAPQLMTEKSDADQAHDSDIRLAGDVFLAPRWGDATNVRFHYRLTVGMPVGGRQVVRLYLTAEGAAEEFLAFEYVYTRRSLS